LEPAVATLKVVFSHFEFQNVFLGKVSLGRIHMVAAHSCSMNQFGVNDYRALAAEIQRRQRNLVSFSSYHLTAAAKLFRVPSDIVLAALRDIKGSLDLNDTAINGRLGLPENRNELWTIVLQSAHILEPLIKMECPVWSAWLCASHLQETVMEGKFSTEVTMLSEAIIDQFRAAEEKVRSALRDLRVSGFHDPSAEHVLQVAQKGNQQPTILLQAAITFLDLHSKNHLKNVSHIPSAIPVHQNVLPSQERLGYWGFHDTAFVLGVDTADQPYVSVKGNRYSYGNKRFRRLIPFIEEAVGTKIDPRAEQTPQFKTAHWKLAKSEVGKDGLDFIRDICSEVSVSAEDRTRHGTGHALSDVMGIRYGQSIRIPDVVVWPSSTGEIESLVCLAARQQWCLIPYGGGTSVSGAVCCPSRETEPRPIVSVDTRRLNKVIDIDYENCLAHVEAGITGLELMKELRSHGFTVGHEPDSLEFSTLGGWIATKASGMKRNKYGNIEDIVTGVHVAGADGVMKHGHWGRESCGLDLTALMLGSEGCLGIIVSAVVRIHELPQTTDYDALLLPDLETGIRLIKDIARIDGGSPASCRLLDNEHFRLGQALQSEHNSIFKQLKEQVLSLVLSEYSNFSNAVVCLAIGYEGTSGEVKRQKRSIRSLARVFGAISLGSNAGKASYEMTFMIAYLRDFALSYQIAGESFETFAPWSELSSIIQGTKERINVEHSNRSLPGKPFIGCRVTQIYSDGVCLYFYLCISLKGINEDDGGDVFSTLENAARNEILERGGSLSHHHGIGKIRKQFLPKIHSSSTQRAFRAIKQALDPCNIFGAQNGSFANPQSFRAVESQD